MVTIELGNIGNKEQAQKLVSKLNGKTYMNFIVDYGIYAGNYPVSVSTNSEVTEDELKNMLLFVMASEL